MLNHTQVLLSRNRCLAAPQTALLDAEEAGLAVVVPVADLALLLAPNRQTGTRG
jgi:hypothetical protein